MVPTLLAVAHGTADPAGVAAVEELLSQVAALRPDVPVRLGWLERAEPSASAVLARLAGPVIVVPALLSTGYHVTVDIGRLVAGRPSTAVASQLGPDRRLAEVVADRLRPVRRVGTDVVLFGAGSSDPAAFDQLRETARLLASLLAAAEGVAPTVHSRFLTDASWQDGLPDLVDVAGYLLAPGHFQDRLAQRAAAVGAGVPAPLGADPRVAEVLWDRYDAALADLDSNRVAGSG